MHLQGKQFWAVMNGILLLGIVVVLAWVVFGHGWNTANTPGPGDAGVEKPAPHSADLPARREVNAGRVGVRPVSFTPCAASANLHDAWAARGVQMQEWASLPASPGMDMSETSAGYLLTFSLPGVRHEDLRLSMTDRVVTVQAVVRDPRGNQVGGMERRVLLPRTPGEPGEFKALFTNGILRVCVAK